MFLSAPEPESLQPEAAVRICLVHVCARNLKPVTRLSNVYAPSAEGPVAQMERYLGPKMLYIHRFLGPYHHLWILDPQGLAYPMTPFTNSLRGYALQVRGKAH